MIIFEKSIDKIKYLIVRKGHIIQVFFFFFFFELQFFNIAQILSLQRRPKQVSLQYMI